MGGICGQIGLEPRSFQEPILEQMVKRLVHRGSQVKRLRRPSVWFASLAVESPMIWPPEGLEQPRELSVVVDGAIDNQLELAQELGREGYSDAAGSATTAKDSGAGLLAAGFRAHGPAFLNRVRGSFAAAVHDHDVETTWLIRDPLGTCPLYLHRTRSRILFASEIRALLADPAVRPDLDPTQLRVLLALGFNPAPNTLLKGIHKMPPGHLLEVTRAGIRVLPYDLPAMGSELDLSFEEAVEGYRSTLARVVRRCDGGENTGVLLSGGPDSSALVLLRKKDGRPITTFTAGFPDAREEEDERVPAWQAARALGVMHRERLIESKEIGPLFSAVARVIEEPVAAGWMPPYFRLLDAAVGHVPLIWSGQGTGALHGEETLWRWLQWGQWVAGLPTFFGRIIGAAARRLDGIRPSYHGSRLLAIREERERVLSSFFLFDDVSLTRMLRAGHVGGSEVVRKLLDRWREPVAERDPLAQALYIRARTFLPEAVFIPAKRLAAEHRLSLRFPYSDAELVRWLERLPATYRLEGAHGKRLHREALGAWIPADVLARPKRTLTDAVRRWLRGEGRERVSDWLLGPNAWLPSVLDGIRVRRLIEDGCRGRLAVEPLVLLVQLELWARETFLGGLR